MCSTEKFKFSGLIYICYKKKHFPCTITQSGVEEGDIDHNIWGELESESEESSEEEEDEENEDIDTPLDESGLVTPAEGMVTPSGLTSVTAGMETPDTIELRKKKIESEMEE